MSYYRSYFSKNNTIIKDSQVNTAKNPNTEIFYGSGFSRFIFQLDIESLKKVINDGQYVLNNDTRHILHLTNTIFGDEALLRDIKGNDKERATSFDLILFTIPQYWDEGVGFDYEESYDFTSGNQTYDVRPSNWNSRTTLNQWTQAGIYAGGVPSGVTITTIHFDNGNEDIHVDITSYVNNILSGTTVDYGLGLCFSNPYLDVTSEYDQSVAFFTKYTQTFFEPYLETVFDDRIDDNRENFYIDSERNLYLYVNYMGNAFDLDELPVVDILDYTNQPIPSLTGLTTTKIRKGVYKVSFGLSGFLCDGKRFYYDKWCNLKIDGKPLSCVTQKFIPKPFASFFDIGANLTEVNRYAIQFFGVSLNEKIKRGTKRKIAVTFKSINKPQSELIDESYYRIYIKEGKTQVNIFDWTQLDRTNENSFILDTSYMIPREYWIEIKARVFNEDIFYRDEIKFEIVSEKIQGWEFPTPSISVSPSISATPSISVTPSISETPLVTPSISETPSVSLTPSISETPSPTPSTSPLDLSFKFQVNTGAGFGITLPHLNGYYYNYNVDYGDGTGFYNVTSYNDPNATHIYANAGIKTVTIVGLCETFSVSTAFTNYTRSSIVQILNWGNVGLKVLSLFRCNNLTSIPTDTAGAFSGITSFYRAFFQCPITTIPNGLFNFATNVTTFQETFNQTQITAIPNGLFDNCPLATNFQSTFANTQLASIPSGLFDNNPLITNVSTLFTNTNITDIPVGLFNNNPLITNVVATFNETNIQSIPMGLFDNNPLIDDLSYTFGNNTLLTGITAGLFDNNPNVINMNGTFSGCVLIKDIPSGLFDNNINVTIFDNTFGMCTSLTGITSNLFQFNTAATSFYYTFGDCTSLLSIPANLFDSNTLVTNMSATFYNCSSLTSIPSGLFDYNINVLNIDSTFYGCTNITAIPSGLFNNNINVTSFASTFNLSGVLVIPSGLFDFNTLVIDFPGIFGGTPITTIPSGLFDYTTSVVSFNDAFSNCTSLTTLPNGLFKNTNSVLYFNNTFTGCGALTGIPLDTFSGCTSILYMVEAFRDCVSLDGNAPDVWNTNPSANGTDCFTNATGLDNYYTEIPLAWGGGF